MYVKDLRAISAQNTIEGFACLQNAETLVGGTYMAQEPDYAGLIRASMLRRMGKSIRIGIGAGMPLLQKHAVDGIIIGSSDGGLEDCIKFLNQIVDYDEGTLTPTNFVQSTPNALAGHLALMVENKGYNITHVHKGLAFENSLLDALLLFQEGKAQSLLVGNVEEISNYNYNIELLAGQFKDEPVTSATLLASNTPGTVCGEGSAMFVLSASADRALAQIVDLNQYSGSSEKETMGMVDELLSRNQLSARDIDAIILGMNGDNRTDFWYQSVGRPFADSATVMTFKNLIGEYPTASAFAVYLSAHLLSGAPIPPQTLVKDAGRTVRKVLVYNHFKGLQHSVILLSA